MQKITDELIEKFLKGLCTKEESAAVMAYLDQNPDEPGLSDEFSEADGEAPLPPGYKDEMLGFILAETGIGVGAGEGTGIRAGAEREIGQGTLEGIGTNADALIGIERGMGQGRGTDETAGAEGEGIENSRSRWIRRWAVGIAATMILGFCAVYLLRPGRTTEIKVPGTQMASVIWVDKYNGGRKDLEMALPDGSKVSLTPGTRIRFRKDFLQFDKRLVDLVGKARFEVMKNDKIPFMVTSQGLNTCVLGTTFEVTALPSSDRIKVRLIEGKVMLSLENLVAGNERKEYYLEPGQELVFNRVSHNVAINVYTKQRKEIEAAEPHYAVSRPDSVSNWYMFNNQSLADVLEQLSMIYNVKIQYSRRELSRLYFIGKLEKKDSLHKIIQDIAILNHLKVTDQNGSYIITKTKP